MLKSLFSGVSGLQSHQVAMDIESNNIANVNTTGFKYARANFSNLLAQTRSIATAPQGALGGKNPVQVGLGSTVASATTIFSQGSIQNSDKNTDVAIQGDGFFIISPDGGNTYKYTRAGDFKFDAGGNFVDNNGFIAQGWLRNETTGKVDSTAPITDIKIAPGLTTPASPTGDVVLKANLNSGPLVQSFSPAYQVASGTPPSKQIPAIYTGDALDSAGNPIDSGNVGVMFNEIGEAFSLQAGQGVWASFKNATVTSKSTVLAGAGELNVTFALDDGSTTTVVTTGGLSTNTAAQNGNRYVSALNAKTSVTGITASYDTANNKIILRNDNSSNTASHNVRIASIGNANAGFTIGSDTTAYKYQYATSGSDTTINQNKIFTTLSDLRSAMELQARAVGDHNPTTYEAANVVQAGNGTNEAATFTLAGTSIVVPNGGGSINESNKMTFGTLAAGKTVVVDGLTLTATAGGGGMTANEVAQAFASVSNGVTPVNPAKGTFTGSVAGWNSGAATGAVVTFTSVTAGKNVTDLTFGGTTANAPTASKIDGGSTANDNGAKYVKAINDKLIPGVTATYDTGTKKITISNTNNNSVDLVVTSTSNAGLTGFPVATTTINAGGNGTPNESNIKVIINKQGKFEITNPGGSLDGDYDINLKITALSSTGITENTKFTANMSALNAVLPAGTTGKAFSQSFNAATHSSSIDIYDSLGSKHTLRMEFRKTALDKKTGSTWDMKLTVPEPASIDTISPFNEKSGAVRFNSDGSLATYDPQNISFSGNNGSSPEQQVNLTFGTANAFDGMTSFDSKSSTSGISQDGFTGGDLVGIRIDQSGTLVGSFSNGRSFGLAQIGMAKFTNNEGLSTEGGNVYIQTANSGDPIIGTAATAGRGFIQSAALEASNVDLSRALTQLIIIQRGFQANGKTITTSDQLLQTLIGLKN